MLNYLLIIGTAYILVLMFFSWRTKKILKTLRILCLAGSKIGVAIGLMTFAATLFSTFTLLGCQTFQEFMVLALGYFLLSDAVMVFFNFMVRFLFEEKSREFTYQGMSALLQNCYQNRLAGYLYFTAVFFISYPFI